MKWLKRLLRNWVNDHGADQRVEKSILIRKSENTISVDEEGLQSQPLRLKVYRASGGSIVETSIYDRVKDRSITGLHIIMYDQDFGESLGKIITMENLRA